MSTQTYLPRTLIRMQSMRVLHGLLLPDAASRWRPISFGFGLQLLLVAAVILVSFLMPETLEIASRYWSTTLTTSEPVAQKLRKPKMMKLPTVKRSPAPAPAPALSIEPKMRVYAQANPKPITSKIKPSPTPTPVVTDIPPTEFRPLGLGAMTPVALKKPRAEVSTGSFAGQSSAPQSAVATSGAMVGTTRLLGEGFNSSTNGSGGARKGARGVEQGLFGDENSRSPEPRAKAISNVAPKQIPVEILSKPSPKYTQSARERKIEGDVLLEVTFLASGELLVKRVIKGLGFGLDEAAVAAAQGMRFRPSQIDGKEVDSSAIVHIVFELAY